MGFPSGCGSVVVGTVATVWDRKIAGIRLALHSVVVSPVLVLSDSQAAIASVRNAASYGSARTADLRAVVDLVGIWGSAGVHLWFACVKVHISVAGNKLADVLAKEGCECDGDPVVTEGGIRAF